MGDAGSCVDRRCATKSTGTRSSPELTLIAVVRDRRKFGSASVSVRCLNEPRPDRPAEPLGDTDRTQEPSKEPRNHQVPIVPILR